MRSALQIVRFIIMVISGVCGTFLNSIIVALNFRYLRDVTISGGYNKILFTIGLMNIIFQGVLIYDNILETFQLYLSHARILIVTFTLEIILSWVSIWNTTWLSIFCCSRLVNSSHWIFVKIKAMFHNFLPHLIVGSVLFSVVTNVSAFWAVTLDNAQNMTDYQPISGYRMAVNSYYIIFCSLFGFFVPFSMICVSIGLSVNTLLRHIWRMGSSDSNITSTQLQGHYRAVRTMVMRLILDTFFFFTSLLGPLIPSIVNSIHYAILWIIVLMYPTSQAFILIFGNPKLKMAVYGLIKALG